MKNQKKYKFSKTSKINNTSTLEQHTIKKGVIQPPLNTIPNMNPTHWNKDRLPEYLWLGLILIAYENRTEGIETVGKILKGITKINNELIRPRLSDIFSLDDDSQEDIYSMMCNIINYEILSPLTVIFRDRNYNIFNKYFYDEKQTVIDRLQTLSNAIKTYYDHQSYESTDLRFCAFSLMVFQKKIRFSSTMKHIKDTLMNYPYTSHDNKIMRSYRPTIRSMEMSDMMISPNRNFLDNFWREVSMKIECEPKAFKYNASKINHEDILNIFKNVLQYINVMHKEKCIFEEKYDVVMGSISYILKIFNEITSNNLTNGILGRNGLRTIIEVYITIKYLLKIESEEPNIWKMYKVYGIGKYKLPLLKEREEKVSSSAHFFTEHIEALINEDQFEEFLDVDTRYFDKKSIKSKFEEVDEYDLYHLSYEYDTNFVHGFWGAVRESSMYQCQKASHQYHLVPDINFELNLPDVKEDMINILEKLLAIICDIYKVPKEILESK